MIDTERGAHLWADRFETDRRNLAQAQSEIAGRLARTLNVQLVAAAGQRIDQERAADPDARDLVMRGNAFFLRPFSITTRQEGLLAFERALAIDPESVDARIGIANNLVANILDPWSTSPAQDAARAGQLLNEALEPLCCTDQQPGAVSPCSDILREANVFRPAKLQRAVERGDSNRHLGRLPPFGGRAQRVTDDALVAADIGLHQARQL